MDADFDSAASSSHAKRALSLIAVSLAVIVCTGFLYVAPSLPSLIPSRSAATSPTQSSYRVAAVDFVNPRIGWVVALLAAGDLAVLHTTDGGASWTRQLAVAGDVHPTYVKFFDERVGILALLGVRPVLYRTGDGGATWITRPALDDGTAVISWSFVDSDHGWMLVRKGGAAAARPARPYRTQDGGLSWD